MAENDTAKQALVMAAEVAGRIDAHEKAHEREFSAQVQFQQEMRNTHARIEDSIKRVHERIDAIGGRWLKVSGVMILVLLGVVGALVYGTPWQ